MILALDFRYWFVPLVTYCLEPTAAQSLARRPLPTVSPRPTASQARTCQSGAKELVPNEYYDRQSMITRPPRRPRQVTREKVRGEEEPVRPAVNIHKNTDYSTIKIPDFRFSDVRDDPIVGTLSVPWDPSEFSRDGRRC